jgi:hypothetical protein
LDLGALGPGILWPSPPANRYLPAYWLMETARYTVSGRSALLAHLFHLALFVLMGLLMFGFAHKVAGSVFGAVCAVLTFLWAGTTADSIYRLGRSEPYLVLGFLLVFWAIADLQAAENKDLATPGARHWGCLVGGLVMATGSKETTVLWAPATVLLWALAHKGQGGQRPAPALRRALAVLAILHVALMLALPLFFWLTTGALHSGKAAQYSFSPDVLTESARRYWERLLWPEYGLLPWLAIGIFGIRLAGLLSRRQLPLRERWQLVCLAYMAVSFGVMTAWPQALGQYMLPASAFFSLFIGIEASALARRKAAAEHHRAVSAMRNLALGALTLCTLWFLAHGIRSGRAAVEKLFRLDSVHSRMVAFVAARLRPSTTVLMNLLYPPWWVFDTRFHLRAFYGHPAPMVQAITGPVQARDGDLVVSWRGDGYQAHDATALPQLVKRPLKLITVIADPVEPGLGWDIYRAQAGAARVGLPTAPPLPASPTPPPALPCAYVFADHVRDARWERVTRTGEVAAKGVGRDLTGQFIDSYAKVGGVVNSAIRQHPEWQKGPGYNRALFPDVPVPKGKSELTFAIGIPEEHAPRSDGVVFKIGVIGTKGKEEQVFEKMWSADRNRGWDENRVDMSKYAGQTVQVVVTVDCGPNDNTLNDHAAWSELVLRPKL